DAGGDARVCAGQAIGGEAVIDDGGVAGRGGRAGRRRADPGVLHLDRAGVGSASGDDTESEKRGEQAAAHEGLRTPEGPASLPTRPARQPSAAAPSINSRRYATCPSNALRPG